MEIRNLIIDGEEERVFGVCNVDDEISGIYKIMEDEKWHCIERELIRDVLDFLEPHNGKGYYCGAYGVWRGMVVFDSNENVIDFN